MKLNAEIKEIVAKEQVLCNEIDKIIAELDLSANRQGEGMLKNEQRSQNNEVESVRK